MYLFVTSSGDEGVPQCTQYRQVWEQVDPVDSEKLDRAWPLCVDPARLNDSNY
jgi:hypothetical protein